jgi:hypothetical protein
MLIETTSHLDRLGYYEVDGHKYLHKVTAYEHAGKDWNRVHFNFNDQAFAAYDWSQEPRPDLPLWEFYRNRAQHLRDKYQYLVVMFSGGPDSKNMLDAFIDNDIFVDEIVCINSWDRTHVHEGTIHNADWVHNAKPALDDWIKNKNLKSRITILDEIDLAKKYMLDLQSRGDWELAFGSTGWVGQFIFKCTWLRHVPHLWQMMLDYKKVGVLVGSEKPNIWVDKTGRYYTGWPDLGTTDAHFALAEDADLRSVQTKEWFYHSPDYPELIAKQLHVLMNFMEEHRDPEFYYAPGAGRRPHHCRSRYNGMELNYQTFHKILYPKWKPTIVTPKSAALKDGRIQDTWWMRQLDEDLLKFWTKCFLKIAPYRKMPFIWSRPIYINKGVNIS